MDLKSPGWVKVTGVATVCALAGAGAGIAGSTAATSTSNAKARSAKSAKARFAGRRGFGPMMGGHGPSVHEESVVLDKAGKAWITETEDRGTLKSVSGQDLTLTEGTKAVPYKDVTVTIPSGATIVRNGRTAQLSDLKAGDHVNVSSSSDGTTVFAGDATFGPGGPHGFGARDGDHHGPPPGAPGPPPGAPAMPGAPGPYPGAP
ncbi:hypothetical protein NBH00_02565 [Paraconexibacter antarcticus]|uniref:DUF5666 domain-containing protein n=1 Tax=Paraconexibacter antarcticus TaxID=2949664 RepID=A0ABY5DW63_9ACTN|nr:hypothetical protein [Paraconexibacter antarcticus]UTI65102.1 hypothetical protein NBH00_02565 [Paraconexibacter antarcticus]